MLALLSKPRFAAVAALFGLSALALVWSPDVSAQVFRVQPLSATALDEKGAPLTIDDVTRPSLAHAFRPVFEMPTTNRSITRWYRLVAPRINDVPLVLTISDRISDADLYSLRGDGSYALVRFGMRVPFASRTYPSIFPTIALTPQMRAGSPLYVRAYGPPDVPSITSQKAFDEAGSAIERWTFCFAGFLFAIGMASIFLSLYLREPVFGLQALLMAMALLFTLINSDLAWKYVWPSASIDSVTADNVVFIAYLFALLLFSRSFLSLDRSGRRMDGALWSTFALNCIVTFVAVPLAPDSSALNLLRPLVNFLPFPLLLAASIIRWRDGFRQARFFTIGLAGMIGIFVVAGLFHEHPLARWGFDLGVAFDSLFFQFALADRLLSANRARDEAQRKALAAQDQLVRSQEEALTTLAEHNEAFSRFVPHEFLTLLDKDDIVSVQLGDHVEREMAVLFLDVRSFTSISEGLTPQESFDFVNAFLAQVGPVVRDYGGFVDKYIGDAVMALFSGAADNALDAAIALHQQVRRFNESRARALLRPISVGVGLHCGRLMLGTIGDQKRLETTVIAGAVNIASRLEQLTKTFGAQIVVSSALVAAMTERQKYHLRSLGPIHIRGLSGDLDAFEVCDADEPEVLLAKMSVVEDFERGVQAFGQGEYDVSLRIFENIVAQNPKDLPAAYYRSRAIAETQSSSGISC